MRDRPPDWNEPTGKHAASRNGARYLRRTSKRPKWAEELNRQIAIATSPSHLMLLSRCTDPRFWMALRAGLCPWRYEAWQFWKLLHWEQRNAIYRYAILDRSFGRMARAKPSIRSVQTLCPSDEDLMWMHIKELAKTDFKNRSRRGGDARSAIASL